MGRGNSLSLAPAKCAQSLNESESAENRGIGYTCLCLEDLQEWDTRIGCQWSLQSASNHPLVSDIYGMNVLVRLYIT